MDSLTQVKKSESIEGQRRRRNTVNYVTLQAIKNARSFDGLEERGYSQLAEAARRLDLKKREVLFAEGEQGKALFLLVDGCVQLTKVTPDGNEVVIRTIKEGEIFAEVILFEGNMYPVTATATTASRVLSFARQNILRLLDQPAFRNDFIASLMRKQRYLADRVRYLTSYDVGQRFLLFLRDHYGESDEVTVDLSKKDLAAAIGATPETLSRLIKRLENEELLEWRDKTIAVSRQAWEMCDSWSGPAE